MNDDDRDGLDELMDRALSTYSSVDPLAGIERRVLQRIHSIGTQRQRFQTRKLAFAVPVLATAIMASIVLPTWWRSKSRMIDTPVVNAPGNRAPQAVRLPKPLAAIPTLNMKPAITSRKSTGRARSGRQHTSITDALPKDECFPSASPLTAEERALLAWVERAPAEARQAFTDLKERIDDPVSIQPIYIEPLQSDGTY